MFFCLCCNLTQAPFSSSGPGSFRLRPGRPGRRCLQPGGRPPPEAALAGRPGPQRDSKQSPKQQRLSLSRDFPKRNTGAAPRASPSCRGPPGPVLPKPSLSLSPSAWPKSSHLLQAEHRMCVESCSATSTFPRKGRGVFPWLAPAAASLGGWGTWRRLGQKAQAHRATLPEEITASHHGGLRCLRCLLSRAVEVYESP